MLHGLGGLRPPLQIANALSEFAPVK